MHYRLLNLHYKDSNLSSASVASFATKVFSATADSSLAIISPPDLDCSYSCCCSLLCRMQLEPILGILMPFQYPHTEAISILLQYYRYNIVRTGE
jgi:hypothetical protein